MLSTPDYKFWFVTGSQFLYGDEQLKSVEKDAKDIVDKLNKSGNLPYPIEFKLTATKADNITKLMKDANHDDSVAGVITWMHTFSSAKMWIRGTQLLQKPLLHLATQYLDHIPYKTIDMDYMNLNQSAHGDREYGYINARLRMNNKVVYGWWGDKEVQNEIADWQDVAVAYNESFKIKVMSFGGKMRNVAVTDGDKIEAQIQLGWTVDYYAVGDLVAEMDKVTDADINQKYDELAKTYTMNPGDNDEAFFEDHVKYQIREYFGLKRFMSARGYTAFSDNFEDLYGLKELPGLAVQLLMAEGYGFAGEGDWKTAALDRLMKIISHNKKTAFMEDYTLDLRKGHEAILGSHMLEVDPTLATDKPKIEVHPLDIGDREDPARLVFAGGEGDAVDVTLADFGDEYRLIMYEVAGHKADEMPKLPVAKQMWTPKAGLKEGATQWIQNGGGHHTVFSFGVTAQQVEDFTNMVNLHLVNIK